MTGLDLKRRSNTGVRYVNWCGWYDTADGRGLCLARWMAGHKKRVRSPRGARAVGARLFFRQHPELRMCGLRAWTRRR